MRTHSVGVLVRNPVLTGMVRALTSSYFYKSVVVVVVAVFVVVVVVAAAAVAVSQLYFAGVAIIFQISCDDDENLETHLFSGGDITRCS